MLDTTFDLDVVIIVTYFCAISVSNKQQSALIPVKISLLPDSKLRKSFAFHCSWKTGRIDGKIAEILLQIVSFPYCRLNQEKK